VKSCVAIWAFDGPSVTARIAKVAEAGFEAVSMTDALRKTAQEEWDDVIAVIERYDLLLTFHLALGTHGTDRVKEMIQPNIADAIEWQRRTGRVVNCTFDSAYFPDETNAEKIWDAEGTITGLRHALEQLSPHGIKVGIENWLINHRLDQFRLMKEEVGREDLYMLLDVGHLNIALRTPATGIVSSREWIESVPMDIIELHLHDNHGELDEHLALGEGEIDLVPIIAGLKARGFDGIATMEVGFPKEPRNVENPAVVQRLVRTREAFLDAWRGSA